MKRIITLLAVLYCQRLLSQTVVSDSRGNNVFSFYKAGSFSQEIETGKEELSFTYAQPLRSYFNYINHDTSQKTIAKSYAVLAKAKLINTEGDVDVKKIKAFKAGWEFELGIQKTLDKIYDIRRMRGYGVIVVGGVSGFLNIGNFMYYDTVLEKKAERNKPVSGGIRGNLAIYKWRCMATQITGSLKWGWNDEDLADYVAGAPIYNKSGYVAYDEPEKGKLGGLQKNTTLTGSFTNPFFPVKSNSYMGRLFFAPYITVAYTVEKTTTYPGVMLGMLGQSAKGTNYTLDKGFGIGMDWKNGKDATVFVRGTFNIGEVREDKRTEQSVE